MTTEIESPAGVTAPEGEQAQSVPQVTTPSTNGAETTAPLSVPSEAPKTAEPDWETLISREDVVERLLQHPKAQQRLRTIRQADIDRQANEKADGILRQRDAEYAKQRETEKHIASLRDELRIIDEDPTHPLAQQRRPQIVDELEKHQSAAVRQQVARELLPSLQDQAVSYAGQQWLDMLAQWVQSDESLTDDEKVALNPRDPKFKTPNEFKTALFKAVISREAQKLAKEIAKIEVEALLQQRLGQERSKQGGVAHLPQGEPAQDDSAFMADYGIGKSNNTARQIQWMRANGVLP